MTPGTETSEPALLAAARGGNRGAIEELLSLHEDQIYRFGLRMCGNEEAAREVLQETLLAAFRGLPGFRGEAALSTWLYQIARRFCIKAQRHAPAGEAPEEDALASAHPGADPEASAHARELGAVLAAAVKALPPELREAVVLRDVEGLSAAEAAEVIGIEVGALKSRLHRGRLQLRADVTTLLGDPAAPAGSGACPELAQELAAYAASEVDQATCVKLDEHLARCARCRDACATLRRTVGLCRRMAGDEVPPPVRAAVRRALAGLAVTGTP